MPDIIDFAADGNSQAVFQEMRVRSLFSPYYFEYVVLGCSKMVDHFHGEELELFVNNLLEGIRKQAIEFPRGCFKTTCYTIGFGIWLILPHTPEDRAYAVEVLGIDPNEWDKRMELHNQDYVQLLAFENITNAKRKVLEIKLIFEGGILFRACFPEIAYTGKEEPWSTEALRIRRTPRGQRIGEASFQAIGVGGALQSQHYDVIWEDDVVGEAAISSPSVMAGTIQWHGLLNGAMNGPNLGMGTYRFLVSNRWGFDDLNSHVAANEKDFVFHTRAIYEYCPIRKQDEPIFPEQFPWKVIRNIQTSSSMTKFQFSSQYLNQPIPPGENEVTTSKIHTYTVDDRTGQITCQCGYKTFATHLKRYMHYDPYNAKGANSTSAPAIAVVGLSVDRHIFLLDYFVAKGDYNKIYDQLVDYNNKYWPDVLTYEDVGHQNMCAFYLQQLQKTSEFKEARNKAFRRILPATTGGRAKEIRIRDSLFPIFENGKFAIREKHTTFIQMLSTWPHRVPGHDYDLLDALAQGGPIWRFPVDPDQQQALQLADEAVLLELGKPYSFHRPTVQ